MNKTLLLVTLLSVSGIASATGCCSAESCAVEGFEVAKPCTKKVVNPEIATEVDAEGCEVLNVTEEVTSEEGAEVKE